MILFRFVGVEGLICGDWRDFSSGGEEERRIALEILSLGWKLEARRLKLQALKYLSIVSWGIVKLFKLIEVIIGEVLIDLYYVKLL